MRPHEISVRTILDKIFLCILLIPCILRVIQSQRSRLGGCEYSSCYPATGDLLIGREVNLSATSTCGITRPERYCIVSHLEDDKKCFTCDSRLAYTSRGNRNSHRVENIVSSFRNRPRWWQARNGQENVSVQLNLEAEFHFTHLIMTFKTFRPKALIIERSYDFGRTWKIYRYFASDCDKIFPGIPRGPVRNLTQVICESKYSGVVPATRGEVIFRVLPRTIVIRNPYSQEVQDLLKLTNLRINFTKLHTLGDDLLDTRLDIQEKYYYAMYDMTVRGSCSCYGHAQRCTPLPGLPNRADMVHGKCECRHFTTGVNCEKCMDMYQDLPWQPARGRESHACKKCNCNEHAMNCRFDPALYEASGQVSGGVCMGCRHNTMGTRCDECKPFFYRDIDRDMSDVHACRPCDCDPYGSQRQGECVRQSDISRSLVAGTCYCRRNVEGARCDTCKDGFWKLDNDNPNGCSPCSCNTVGTIGNLGCNKETGDCRCKRYVAGRECNECYSTFWGLRADLPDGCLSCDCDIGGSLSGECDMTTGQCECRENIDGRTCNQPKDGYYFPGLAYNVYEAEFAKATGNALLQYREPGPTQRPTWTGPGFRRISEGDTLEFKVDGIKLSMYYDIIIRYEPMMPERWDDIRVSVVRPTIIDAHGPCSNIIPQDDLKSTILQPGNRYIVLSPRTCLERGGEYTVKLDFNRYKTSQRTPEANVLIDSIALIPNIESIPIFIGPGEPERMKNEFIRYRCRQYQFGLSRGEVPDVCKKYIFSISSVIHSKAFECNCDVMGSVTTQCDTLGGQCECKNNVVGRTCDACREGSYGFGPQGCLPCNCHATGAKNGNCDKSTGQCECLPNAYGRTCSECLVGFWRFPRCMPCECNGNAETCDNLSGACINCRDNTTGQQCESCAAGYYGDPRASVRIPCQECECPGKLDSGYNHADGCLLDPRTKDMTCRCKPGYTGKTCNECIDNYFGNPIVAGGTCQPCVCNNNIDTNVAGSCNANTGECLKCKYHTTGFNCEHCIKGYWGDASLQGCAECVCNNLGTDSSFGYCDRITGACPCLPNVVGQFCDQCVKDHWNITSEVGCAACACDSEGSLKSSCNQITGDCDCRVDRGGRDCSECTDLYWGDPSRQCIPCDCNVAGSASLQCDWRTGKCKCKPGVAGDRCDRCDRGTTGELPNCVPCGECYDSWDREINDARDATSAVLERINNTKTSGGLAVFEKEFTVMENTLQEVRDLISETGQSQTSLEPLQQLLEMMKSNLSSVSNRLTSIQGQVRDTSKRWDEGTYNVDKLREDLEILKQDVVYLRGNATQVLVADMGGAYNVTMEAKRKSDIAKKLVEQSSQTLKKASDKRMETENLIKTKNESFNQAINEMHNNFTRLENQSQILADNITTLNNMVCDGQGAPCDEQCGGGGCGVCGGPLSCSKGAVNRANDALDLVKQAIELLENKEKDIVNMSMQVNETKELAKSANDEATKTNMRVTDIQMKLNNTKDIGEEVLRNITKRMAVDTANTKQIKTIAAAVLEMKISLTPEEIEALANQISETLKQLSNVQNIIRDTKDDVARALLLKERANNASSDAKKSLSIATEVLNALQKANSAQEEAEKAIEDAATNIEKNKASLDKVEVRLNNSLAKTNGLKDLIDSHEGTLIKLKNQVTENEINIKKAEEEAEGAKANNDLVSKNVASITDVYNDVSEQLNKMYNSSTSGKNRAKDIKERATKLATKLQNHYNEFITLFDESFKYKKKIEDVEDEVARLTKRMGGYERDIKKKAQGYINCRP